MPLSQSTLIDGQEMYTPALVRARLRDGGGFHARSFTTGKLLWVVAIDGEHVRVNYSMDSAQWMFPIKNLKSL